MYAVNDTIFSRKLSIKQRLVTWDLFKRCLNPVIYLLLLYSISTTTEAFELGKVEESGLVGPVLNVLNVFHKIPNDV